MGKSSISTGPCSIAFCSFTRPGIRADDLVNSMALLWQVVLWDGDYGIDFATVKTHTGYHWIVVI